MTTQLSPHEWQALSAYLDGQLSERETRQVEARLRETPDLRAGLEELRRTRAMLRALPKRRAPHNFTISPAQAEQLRPAPRRRAYPVLRLVSAFASFLFVMVFLSDLALNLTTQNLATTAASEAAPQIMQAAEPQMDAAGSMPEEPAQPMEKLPAAAPAEETNLTPDPNALRSFSTDEMPTPNPTEIAAMTAAPSGMGGGILEEAGTPAAELYAPFVSGSNDPEAAEPAPDLPTLKAGGAADSEMEETAREAQAPFDPRSLLRPIEIGLAVIALGAGLAALYARRMSAR